MKIAKILAALALAAASSVSFAQATLEPLSAELDGSYVDGAVALGFEDLTTAAFDNEGAVALITQEAAGHSGLIIQEGATNFAAIAQRDVSGPSVAFINQVGEGNRAVIVQK